MKVKGDLLIFLAMAVFGSYSLFLRFFPSISVLLFLFAFQVIGAIAFFIQSKIRGLPRLSQRDRILLVILAISGVANDLLYFAAFRTTSIANAAISHQSVSIFILFLAPLVLHEKTSRHEWLALWPSIAGVVILYWNDSIFDSSGDFLGISLGIASGLFYAINNLLYRIIPDTERGLGISVINFWRYSMSVILLLPFVVFLDITSLRFFDLIPLIAFGLLFAFIGSGIHTFGVSKSRSLHASLIGKTEPVFAIIYALVLLNEIPTIQSIIGGILIIGSSVWLATRREITPISSKTRRIPIPAEAPEKKTVVRLDN